MGRGTGSEECLPCVGGLLLVASIVGAILLASAFDTVDVNYSAVLEKTLTKDIDKENVFGPGRYLTGLARSFRSYPTTVQIMEFSRGGCSGIAAASMDGSTLDCHNDAPLDAWSADGQDMVLTLSIMYRLVKTEIIEVYSTYKGGDTPWQLPYIEAVKSTLKVAATQYNATDFFDKRQEIAAQMKLKAYNALRPKFAELLYFQLRTVSIPRNLESSILAKVTAKQYKLTREQTNEAQLKRQEIQVLLDTAKASASQINLEAAARANLVKQTAEAEKLRLQVQGEANAYKEFGDKLGLISTDTVYYRFLRMIKNKKVGFDKMLIGGNQQVIINTK